MVDKKPLLLSLLVAIGVTIPSAAHAFCGFYVAGADTKLYNSATMVTLMREGTTTVLSMGNNYQGPPEDFAMVVPVPVVLEKKDVKTLSHDIFDRLDKLAAPRLVEYWEQDPCPAPVDGKAGSGFGTIGRGSGSNWGYGLSGAGAASSVVVEAQFEVGEYEIVILSAKDALGLETWIKENGYKIPAGAAPFLEPYVEQGSKFFVAKVNPAKVTFLDGMAKLSPLRFHYTDKDFRLPIRLGLINAKEKQDLIVHILAKNKRYEVANYENVTIPTNLIVNDRVRDRFGEFYAALFDATTEKNPGAVVTEYSWSANSCDPCPQPPLRTDELLSLGLDVVNGTAGATNTAPLNTSGQRLVGQMREGDFAVGPGLHKEVVRRYVRRKRARMVHCYEKALATTPDLAGTAVLDFKIEKDGTVAVARAHGLGHRAVEHCIGIAARTIQFPPPQNGGTVAVEVPLALTSRVAPRGSLRPASMGWQAPRDWVLTRMHARYDRSSLGEDLVFKEAPAIAGGQGGASDKLDKTAKESGRNSFQGRYIIRHEWTGAMECENPQRGMWGGPPAGIDRDTSAKAATDLAFAPRGGISLANMLSEPLPEVATLPGAGPTPAPEAVATAPTEAVPSTVTSPEAGKRDKENDKGCSSSGGSTSGAALLLLVAVLWARRRSSRGVSAPRSREPGQY